jgi:phosphate transport system substrate-binding protein
MKETTMNVRSSWLVLAALGMVALPALPALCQNTARAPAGQAAAPTAKALTKEAEEKVTVDEAIAAYKPVSGISGSLNSVGSDTLNNLMTLWTESFKGLYPSVHIQVEGKGSGTAPPALIAGTAQLGPMSREMKQSEIDDFEKKYGYKPTLIKVSYDAIAIFVHKDNPIQKLTLAQVDAMYGKQRRRGATKDITTWGELGLTDVWEKTPISLYGRSSSSGTYGYVKEHVLSNGDYKDTVKEQPGSASVVLSVTEDRSGSGYCGIGYRTSGVRAVPIAKDDNSEAVPVTASAVYANKYPITRFLYVYINKAPNKPLDPLVKEFITFVLSQQGQQVVLKEGYPLTAPIAAQELQKIQ